MEKAVINHKVKERIKATYRGKGVTIVPSKIVSSVILKDNQPVITVPLSSQSTVTAEKHSSNILLENADSFYPTSIRIFLSKCTVSGEKITAQGVPQTHAGSGEFDASNVTSLTQLYFAEMTLTVGSNQIKSKNNLLECLRVTDERDFEYNEISQEFTIVNPLSGQDSNNLVFNTNSSATDYQLDSANTKNVLNVVVEGYTVKSGSSVLSNH